MIQRETVVDLVKAAFIVLFVKVMASCSHLIPWNAFLDNLCVIFSVCVTCVKICRLTLPLNKLLILGALSLLCLYTCVRTEVFDPMVTVVAILLLADEDLDEYVPLMLKLEVWFLIGHIVVSVLLSLSGQSDDFWIWTDRRLRFTGGLHHPNVLSTFILSCMLMFAWTRFGRITPNEFGWMTFIAALTFITSKSRTGLLLNLVLLLLLYLTQNMRQLVQKLLDPILWLIFPALSALVFWSQTHYASGSSFALFLDDLLTGRIKFAAYAYHRSGLTWLPRYLDYADTGVISWTPEWRLNGFTYDNVYSFIFMQMGMIWLGIITALIIWVCKKSSFRNKVFFLFWALYAMVEIHGLNCFKFFPLMLLSSLLSENKDSAEEISQPQG